MAKNGIFLDKQTAREIGQALWQIRAEKHLYLRHVVKATNILSDVIEGMELGKFIQYGTIRKLINFYGKKMRITFEENT